MILTWWLCFTCPSSESFKNNEYSYKFSFNSSAYTNTVLNNVVYSNSGAVYYAASDGTTTIFGKDNENNERVWTKAYKEHPISSKSFIVSSDESFIYTIENDNPNYLQILQINATDGTLIMQYKRYGILFINYSLKYHQNLWVYNESLFLS